MSNRFNNPVVAALLVGLGGAIGVGLRYACIMLFSGLALWLVNVAGSFLLAYANEKLHHSAIRLVVMSGMLGSFTTFSSVSYEWLKLFEANALLSIVYAVAMTALCVIAAFLGRWVAKR